MRALGIILAGGNNNRMHELSNKRAIAAMPIGGSYRSIDFTLSNMTNSHIQKVAVLTQYNARSLNEHLSSSKWWDFGRKQGGLFLFPPTITSRSSFWYRGTADAIYQNLTWLKQSHEPYVVIASGDGIYKLDYNKVLEYHISKRADVTVVCTECHDDDVSRFGVLKMNEDFRIEEFDEKPMVSKSNVISAGIYVIRRRQLIELIEKCAMKDRSAGMTKFVQCQLRAAVSDSNLLEGFGDEIRVEFFSVRFPEYIITVIVPAVAIKCPVLFLLSFHEVAQYSRFTCR